MFLATALASDIVLVLALSFSLFYLFFSLFFFARISGISFAFFRLTHVLIQVYFIFYLLPTKGLTISALTAGVISLFFHFSTFSAEFYRSVLPPCHLDVGLRQRSPPRLKPGSP